MVIHTLMKTNLVIYLTANVYKARLVFCHHTFNVIFTTVMDRLALLHS